MSYILIVDDDEDFASAAAKVLTIDGHEVRIELDTESAMQSMLERLPDLAILDVMFPESSAAGFDLARRIRHESEELSRVPLLMLTAVNTQFPLGFSTSDIDDEWMPVDAFLEKPVDLDVLRSRVTSLLGQ
ncbi:response regulator [bacterium]|nr:response regulator [bacterium]